MSKTSGSRLPALSSSSFSCSLAALLRIWPGLAIPCLVAMAATFITATHGGPVLLYALLLGISLHHLHDDPRNSPGINFCARTLLRLGVGLLGARITATQIASLGWITVAIVALGIASTIGLAVLTARRFGLSTAQGVLSGGSVAICGASAALAISAALPRQQHDDRFTLMVVVTVTALSTVAMVIYPLIAQWIGLRPELAGLFLGGTIHDVAQVVGAGYTLGQEAGDIATVVKLFRVAMLTFVVLLVSLAFKADTEKEPEATEPRLHASVLSLIPWFLWLFLAMVALHSNSLIPQKVQETLGDFSRACLVLAIAALGIKTSFKQLAQAGWRPVALVVAETLWLTGFVLFCALVIA